MLLEKLDQNHFRLQEVGLPFFKFGIFICNMCLKCYTLVTFYRPSPVFLVSDPHWPLPALLVHADQYRTDCPDNELNCWLMFLWDCVWRPDAATQNCWRVNSPWTRL